MFGDVPYFAFGVKTNRIFDFVSPPWVVLGVGVLVPVPGWFEKIGTNENRIGKVRCEAAVSAVAVLRIFRCDSSDIPLRVPCGPYVKHVHGAYEYVDN